MSQPTIATDRRAVARRRCRTSTSCRLLGDVPRGAELRDISPQGVGLLCPNPVNPGEHLHLHLSAPRTGLGLALRARVVHSQESPDGRWLAGCVFDERLPESLVALLH
jgi:hypothetical protein